MLRETGGIIPVDGTVHDEYPLVQSRCHYKVLDVYTIAEVIQDYHSNTNFNRDVEYVFPLPPSAAVCSFKAVIDGNKVIKGIVKEKEAAEKEYKEAVTQGKTAGLLKQGYADAFRISLGNIKPAQKISVHISFVSIIPHDGSSPQSLRIMMPTAIAPRYGAIPDNMLRNNRENLFELTVSIQMSKPITSVSSPSHRIGLTLGCAEKEFTGDYEPSKAFVYLEEPMFLDNDIVIVISAQGLDAPRCTTEHWLSSDDAEETTYAYALTLVPKLDLPALPSQEYIFLVDRSESMSGLRIEAVKAGLQTMLRSLPSRNTTFNIISFGSHYTSLWPKSQIYSAETVAEASKHVETFVADYKDAELLSALQFAFRNCKALASGSKARPPTSIFVMTDGEAWDLAGVIELVTENVEAAKKENTLLRTFVMGVGNQVSTAMCEGIARAGQGSAVFVAESEKSEVKLQSLLKAARGGVIEDLAVDWGASELIGSMEDDFESILEAESIASESAPPPFDLFDEGMSSFDAIEMGPQKMITQLPPPPVIQQAPNSDKLPIPLYPGFRCSIFAIIKQSTNAGPHSPIIRITGKVLGREVASQIPVTPITLDTNTTTKAMGSSNLLHTLAAKALIQTYEDMPSSAETKAQIERLGKRYSLASSMTSFLAIDYESTSEPRPLFIRGEQSHRLVESRRSRSRSPRTIIIPAKPESRRSRSRSPRRILRRSHSRSPSPIIMPAIPESRRLRRESPRRTVIVPAEPELRRSRSRSPRRVILPMMPESRRSRSRSPRRIIIPAAQGSRRSRSPRTIVVQAPETRRRSRSPRVIMEAPRSRSRERHGLMRDSRRSSPRPRSRSRSPIIIRGPERRRSYSPQMINASDSERNYGFNARNPVIIQGERGGNRRGFMSRLFRNGRSPSPARIFMAGGRRRSRTPPIIINGNRGNSRSPSRRILHGRRSRTPPIIVTGGNRNRSRSPYRFERRHSRSPSIGGLDYDAGTRRNRGYGSPRRSRSPLRGRLSRSPEDRRPSHRRSRSPTRPTPSFLQRTASPFGTSRDGPNERNTRTRLNRRSPSPVGSSFSVEPRPRSHHSGRPRSPRTVVVPEGMYAPFGRPDTKRQPEEGPLSTIHEADSVRIAPSVIQLPGPHVPRNHAALQAAYSPFGPITPSIIRLPGEQTPWRTGLIVRVVAAGTPAPNTLSNIQLPGAPRRPSNERMVRVGHFQNPEPYSHPVCIQLPGQLPTQIVRVTPSPSVTPSVRIGMLQPPTQGSEPSQRRTVSVEDLPAQRTATTQDLAHVQPSIIQMPIGDIMHGSSLSRSRSRSTSPAYRRRSRSSLSPRSSSPSFISPAPLSSSAHQSKSRAVDDDSSSEDSDDDESFRTKPLNVELVARMQEFDGSFPRNSPILKRLFKDEGNPHDVPPMPAMLANLTGTTDVKELIWATILVLKFLQQELSSEKDAWEAIANKATEFIDTALNDMGEDSSGITTTMILNAPLPS